MEHEDFEQFYWQAKGYWVTLCTCGTAFWSEDSQTAYEAWEQHEAKES